MAGILISKDYSKTLTVLKRITKFRQLAKDLELKKEGVAMMYKGVLEQYADELQMSKIQDALNKQAKEAENSNQRDTEVLRENKRQKIGKF
jgi:hypothetical protein